MRNSTRVAAWLVPRAGSASPMAAIEAPASRVGIGLYLVLAVYLALFALAYKDVFASAFVIQNDERQQIMPYLSFHNPGILQGSLIRDYMFAYTSTLHKGLYYLLSFLFSPFVCSKLVTLGLYAVVILYSWKFGQLLRFPAAGAMIGVLILSSGLVRYLAGGLPRSFAVPLVLAFLYYFVAGSERGSLLVLVLAAGFYPSVLLVCGLGYSAQLAAGLFQRGVRWFLPPALRLMVVAGLSFLLVLPNLRKPDFIGKVVTLKQASTMQEFGPRGRLKGYLPFKPLHKVILQYISAPFDVVGAPLSERLLQLSKAFPLISLLWIGLSVLFLVLGRTRKLVPKLVVFAASAAAMYVLACLVAFQLFIPSRMLEYALPLATVVTLAMGIATAPVRKSAKKKFDSRVLLVCLLLLTRTAVYGTGLDARIKDFGYIDCRSKKALYEFFKQCPKDSTIAGDPYELSNVMSFSGRDCYVTYEGAHPLYNRYFEEIRRRFNAFHRAYFAREFKDLSDFLETEGIDYILLNRDHFQPTGINYRLFEPFTSELKATYRGIPGDAFVLGQQNLDGVVFSQGRFEVLEAQKLREAALSNNR